MSETCSKVPDAAPDVGELAATVGVASGQVVERIDGLSRLTGGSSREIWSFDAIFATGERVGLVLRRDAPGEERGDAMALEVDVMEAARQAGVPVPRLYVPDGRPNTVGGIVMDRVEAHTDPRSILNLEALEQARKHLAIDCGTALGLIHTLPTTVSRHLEPVDRLTLYRAELDRLDRNRPVLELAYQRLASDRPRETSDVVVHGDFRVGNLAVDETGLVAVLDWESAHVGNRLEDLGWMAIRAWRFRGTGIVGGFGDVAPFLDAYIAASGVDVSLEDFDWAVRLNTWIWAVGCLQQADRHLSGTQRSIDLAMVGRRVVEIEHDLLELMA